MKDLYPLSGVVAIPQTPFDDRDRIDLGSLSRGVADRLAAGVDGLLYPVVASEVSRLTDDERAEATRAVLDQAASRRARLRRGECRRRPDRPVPR